MVKAGLASGARKGDVDRETGEEKEKEISCTTTMHDVLIYFLAAGTIEALHHRAAEVWKLCTHIKVVSSEIDCIVLIRRNYTHLQESFQYQKTFSQLSNLFYCLFLKENRMNTKCQEH